METPPTKGAGSEAGFASPMAFDLGQAVQAASPPKIRVEGDDQPRPKAPSCGTRFQTSLGRFLFDNDGCGA